MALHGCRGPEWSHDLLGSVGAEGEGSARAVVAAPVSGGAAVASQDGTSEADREAVRVPCEPCSAPGPEPVGMGTLSWWVTRRGRP